MPTDKISQLKMIPEWVDEWRHGERQTHRWIWPFVVEIPPVEEGLPGFLGQVSLFLLLGEILLEATQVAAVPAKELVPEFPLLFPRRRTAGADLPAA